jgi:cell division protein FtsQ
VIKVVEHIPVMTWDREQSNDKWVNSYGQVVQLGDQVNLVDVIDLVGQEEDARTLMHKALVWSKQLKQHDLAVKQVSLSGSQSWQMRLERNELTSDGSMVTVSQFELYLGREYPDDRLKRFKVLYDDQLAHSLKRIKRVDARYPNGVAIHAVAGKSNQGLAVNQVGKRGLAKNEVSIRPETSVRYE